MKIIKMPLFLMTYKKQICLTLFVGFCSTYIVFMFESSLLRMQQQKSAVLIMGVIHHQSSQSTQIRSRGDSFIPPIILNYARDQFFDVLYCQKKYCLNSLLPKASPDANWFAFEDGFIIFLFHKMKLQDLINRTSWAGGLVFALVLLCMLFNQKLLCLLKKMFSLENELFWYRTYYHDIQLPIRTLLGDHKTFSLDIQENLKNLLSPFSSRCYCTQQLVQTQTLKVLIDTFRSRASSLSLDKGLEIFLNASLKHHLVLPLDFTSSVINLLKNSYQAGANNIEIQVEEKNLNLLRFVIKDDGRGFEVKALRELKANYYSSKQNGMGVGIGKLRRQLSQFGGSLSIHSTSDEGTLVEFELPIFLPRRILHLEDDVLIKRNWKMRSTARGVEYCSFETFEELKTEVAKNYHEKGVLIVADIYLKDQKLSFRQVKWLQKIASKMNSYFMISSSISHDIDVFQINKEFPLSN